MSHTSVQPTCAGISEWARVRHPASPKQVRDLLQMNRLDPDWSLKSLTDQNPFLWTLIIDGYVVGRPRVAGGNSGNSG